MTLEQLFGVWNNAILKIAESNDKSWRREARRILKLVENQWANKTATLKPEDYFRWPDTGAPGGNQSLLIGDAPMQGMLGFLGYRVGKEYGLPQEARRELLERIFAMRLPPLVSPAYLDEWGEPNTAARLRKLAESIAAFTRNLKRRHRPEFSKAIADWESDLKFLYTKFYVGKFGFGWPVATV